jgi:23S rRNA (guanosine2251-2'-O)-methyltransferase
MEPLIEKIIAEKDNPLFVLLDGITDTRNFGAILRSSAATGVDAVFVASSGSAPLNGDVVKTSAGGAFKVPISKVKHLKDVVYFLEAQDVPTLAITEKASQTIYEKKLSGPIALVFGSEDVGISHGLLKILKEQAKLPMQSAIDSLNVSVACGVVFYEVVRQRS